MDIESGFENYLNDFNELKTGHIAIGGSNLYTSFVLPPSDPFHQRFPAVNIRLEEADSAQLKKRLFAGILDLVIDNSSWIRTSINATAIRANISCWPFRPVSPPTQRQNPTC